VTIAIEVADKVAEITLQGDSEGRLDSDDLVSLAAALNGVARHPGVQAVVLTGAEGRFCGGRRARPGLVSEDEILADLQPILAVNQVFAEPGPLYVAAVEGPAFGFGLGLAVQCDLTIAGEGAEFALPELAHGIPPLLVLSYLTRLMPYKAALDLTLTGRRIPALEAHRLGLATRLVPDGSALAAARTLVSQATAVRRDALRLMLGDCRSRTGPEEMATARAAARRISALLAAPEEADA
jgi:enoyl-CoA hydratase/carnithine racemase